VTDFSCLATKANGKLKVIDEASFKRAWAEVGEGEELEFSLKETTRARLRSKKALGYYWGVVLRMAEEETGQPADDIHDAMVERFIPRESKRIEFVNEMTGEHLPIDVDQRHSPKQGNKFYDFVEEVRLFLREFLNIDTPDPDPDYWRKKQKVA
jgi:hypothetical protein